MIANSAKLQHPKSIQNFHGIQNKSWGAGALWQLMNVVMQTDEVLFDNVFK